MAQGVTKKGRTTASAAKKSAAAKLPFLRIAPRKMRLVIDAIRNQPTGRAFQALMMMKKKAARMVEKVLKTAVANAKVLGMDESRLYISEVRADGGPSMKRFMARSMGRADRILKRTTHLLMKVSEADRPVNEAQAMHEMEAEKGSSKEKKSVKDSPQLAKKSKAAAGV